MEPKSPWWGQGYPHCAGPSRLLILLFQTSSVLSRRGDKAGPHQGRMPQRGGKETSALSGGTGTPYRGHVSHTEAATRARLWNWTQSEAHGRELSFNPSGYRQRCRDKRVCTPSPVPELLQSPPPTGRPRAPQSGMGTAELGHLSSRKEGGSHWPRLRHWGRSRK